MRELPAEPKVSISNLSIVDRVCREKRDLLWVLLMTTGEFTLLPELYEVIGPDKLVRFMELFGGTTIKVPDRDKLCEAAMAIDIFSRCSVAAHRSTAIERMAEEYELPEARVLEIYTSTADMIHGFADIRELTGGGSST